MSELTKKQLKQLQEIIDEITSEAKKMVDDYVKNPSNASGSVIEIHENSPFLKDNDDN